MTGEQAYIASTVLAGETETRVQVEDIELDAMAFRVISPRGCTGNLPCVIYYHGGCFVSGGFSTHDNQLRQLAPVQRLSGHCGAVSPRARAYLPGST